MKKTYFILILMSFNLMTNTYGASSTLRTYLNNSDEGYNGGDPPDNNGLDTIGLCIDSLGDEATFVQKINCTEDRDPLKIAFSGFTTAEAKNAFVSELVSYYFDQLWKKIRETCEGDEYHCHPSSFEQQLIDLVDNLYSKKLITVVPTQVNTSVNDSTEINNIITLYRTMIPKTQFDRKCDEIDENCQVSYRFGMADYPDGPASGEDCQENNAFNTYPGCRKQLLKDLLLNHLRDSRTLEKSNPGDRLDSPGYCSNNINSLDHTSGDLYAMDNPVIEYAEECRNKNKSGHACINHSDCCSGTCNARSFSPNNDNGYRNPVNNSTGSPFNYYGTCAPTKSCTPLLGDGEECLTELVLEGRHQPVCKNSPEAACREKEWFKGCAEAGFQGDADTCCSGVASSEGICIPEPTCSYCTPLGEAPSEEDRDCCPGTTLNEDTGKCIAIEPPFILPASLQQTTSFIPVKKYINLALQTVINFIIPSAYAEDDEEELPDLSNDTLGEAANEEIERKQQECIDKIDNRDEYNSCLKELFDLRNEKLAAATANESGDQSVIATQGDWNKKYQVPAIQTFRGSMPELCYFNNQQDVISSGNDNLKNAEIVMRAFEAALFTPSADYHRVPGTAAEFDQTEDMTINQYLSYLAHEYGKIRKDIKDTMVTLDRDQFCLCALNHRMNNQGDASILVLTQERIDVNYPQYIFSDTELRQINLQRISDFDNYCPTRPSITAFIDTLVDTGDDSNNSSTNNAGRYRDMFLFGTTGSDHNNDGDDEGTNLRDTLNIYDTDQAAMGETGKKALLALNSLQLEFESFRLDELLILEEKFQKVMSIIRGTVDNGEVDLETKIDWDESSALSDDSGNTSFKVCDSSDSDLNTLFLTGIGSIAGLDFCYESNKDQLDDDRDAYEAANQYRHRLYSFEYRKPRGWVRAFAVIGMALFVAAMYVMIAVAPFTIIHAAVYLGVTLSAFQQYWSDTSGREGMMDREDEVFDIDFHKALDENQAVFSRTVQYDYKKTATYRRWNYRRYLYFKYFSQNYSDGNNCQVIGNRAMCVKNFLFTKLDEAMDPNKAGTTEQDLLRDYQVYNQWFHNYKNNPLIDVWFPAFYPSTRGDYFSDGEVLNYVQKVNEGFLRGVGLLKLPYNKYGPFGAAPPIQEDESYTFLKTNNLSGSLDTETNCIKKGENGELDEKISNLFLLSKDFRDVLPTQWESIEEGENQLKERQKDEVINRYYISQCKIEFEEYNEDDDFHYTALEPTDIYSYLEPTATSMDFSGVSGTKPGGSRSAKRKNNHHVDRDVVGENKQFFAPDINCANHSCQTGSNAWYNYQERRPERRLLFDQKKIDTYKAAIYKMAVCESLADCNTFTGIDDIDSNEVTVNQLQGVEEFLNYNQPQFFQTSPSVEGSGHTERYGFAGFFQSPEDIKRFAHYTYHMHFVWPNLASSNTIRYPKLGLEIYIEQIHNTLSTLITEYDNRFKGKTQYSESLADHFNAVAEMNYYDEQSTKVTQGGGEKTEDPNIDFAPNSALNLQSSKALTTKVGDAGNLDKMRKSSRLSQARFARIKSKMSKFASTLKTKNDAVKKWEEKFANTKTGSAVLNAQNQITAAFGRPLNPPTAQELLSGKLGSAGGAKNLSKNRSSSAKKKPSTYQAPNYTPNFGGSNYVSSDSSSYGSSSSSSNTPSNRMSYGQAQEMIQAAARDESLRNVSADDTIFTRVSKAYQRNLGRVLTSKKVNKDSFQPNLEIKKEPEINDKKKEELRSILNDM